MKSSVYKRGTVVFIIIAIVLAVLFFKVQTVKVNTGYSHSVRGVLDLNGWSMPENECIMLNGEWEFYWNRLLGPAEFRGKNLPQKTGFIQVPGSWKEYKTGNKALGDNGYATCRLLVKSDIPYEKCAVDIKALVSSYRMWVDGKLVSSAGQVGKKSKEFKGRFLPRTIYLTPGTNTMEIILQVSSFGYANGGIVSGLYFGDIGYISSMNRRQDINDMLLFGGMLIMALYHFALFFFRRKDSSTLYFGMLCLMIALRILLMGNMLLYTLIRNVELEWFLKASILTICLGAVFFITFIAKVFPQETPMKFTRLCQATGAVYSAVTLFTPDIINDRFLLPYEIIMAGTFLFLLRILIKAIIRRREGAVTVLISLLVIALFAVNDILNYIRCINTCYLIPAGLFIFVFAQSMMLSMKFSMLFTDVEKMSERLLVLDRLKDEFLANTSHELRTPLNGMIGIAQSMLDGAAGKLDRNKIYNLSLIVSCGKRLTNLINDILDFSKLKNGEMRLSQKPLSLKLLADTILDVLKPLSDKKCLKAENRIGDNISLAYGDEDKVQQIFYNLIGNALKFTNKGTISIFAEEKSGYLYISVRDTGIGIQKNRLDDIFVPFEQIDGSTVREYGGTGLGLNITKKLVELHGGSITAESRLGIGSTFTFSLPVYKGQYLQETGRVSSYDDCPGCAAEQSACSDAQKVSDMQQPEKYGSILAVDDDPVNLQVIVNSLSIKGYSVTTASDGVKAMELIGSPASGCFDLLILDIMLPGMSGYQICRILREKLSQSELPILMLTAKSRSTDILAGFEAGANDYLIKPFEREELLARVNALVAMRKSVRQEKELLASELRIMQAQIKPHFLFNALNTIAAFCRVNPAKARELLFFLSDYLRSRFDFRHNEDLIDFKNELMHVRTYLELEQARFAEMLKISYDIDEEISCKVPLLILEPIVENAVKHGLLPRENGGSLLISAKQTDCSVVIQVRDDGEGMSEEKVESVLNGSCESAGIGLRNVNNRLKKLYGKGIEIESSLGKGTLVTINIPDSKE